MDIDRSQNLLTASMNLPQASTSLPLRRPPARVRSQRTISQAFPQAANPLVADVATRLASLEEQVARLQARVNELEGSKKLGSIDEIASAACGDQACVNQSDVSVKVESEHVSASCVEEQAHVNKLEVSAKTEPLPEFVSALNKNQTHATELEASATAESVDEPIRAYCGLQTRVNELEVDSAFEPVSSPGSGPQGKVDSVVKEEMCKEQYNVKTIAKEETCNEIPMNFHQVSMYYCLHSNCPAWRKSLWIISSLTMVFLQVVCGLSISLEAVNQHCVSGTQCLLVGQFCHPEFNRCLSCGDYALDYSGTDNSTEFCADKPFNNLVCEGCHDQHRFGHSWNPTSFRDAKDLIISDMRWYDLTSLVLAFCMIALDCASDLREVMLRQITTRQFASLYGETHSIWRVGFLLLGSMRQFTVLPIIVRSTALLIYRRAKALDIFFNSLAVLFMLTVDDAIYDHVLTDSVKAEVEEFGCATLTRLVKQRLEVHRLSSTILIALGGLASFFFLTKWSVWSSLAFVLAGAVGVWAADGPKEWSVALRRFSIDVFFQFLIGSVVYFVLVAYTQEYPGTGTSFWAR